MSVIFEPEEAVAAARCLAARSIADGVTRDHPRRCGWCDFPLDELRRLVDGFNAWAGWDERRRVFARHSAEAFRHLPKDEQEGQILAAQDLDPLDPPAAAAADGEAPADVGGASAGIGHAPASVDGSLQGCDDQPDASSLHEGHGEQEPVAGPSQPELEEVPAWLIR